MTAAFDLRPARADDAVAVAELAAQLGYFATLDAIQQRLAAALAASDQAVCVADAQGAVIGWIQVVQWVTLDSGAFAEITGLVVDAGWRSRGVGRALVRWAQDWARQRALPRLRVRSRIERQAAHAFYRGLGFDAEKVQQVFTLPLDGALPGAR